MLPLRNLIITFVELSLKRWPIRLTTWVLLGLYTHPLGAQNTAGIFGTVLHEDGPLPAATVRLLPVNRVVLADTLGRFRFENLPAGAYRVVTEYTGHLGVEQKLTLTEGEQREVTLKLEDDFLQTEEVVISSNREEQRRNEVPVLVGRLEAKTFTDLNALNVADAMGFQSGVRTENNCNNCGTTQLRINGLPGPYSQILINNRPIFSALNGVYGLEQLPANLIERVEVVRGGGSAMFGSNAIAGTVNILTREPEKNQWELGYNQQWVGVSTPDHNLTASGSLVNKDKTLGLTLFGNFRDRRPYDATGDGFSEITRLRTQSFGLDGFAKPTLNSKLSLNLFFVNEFRRGGNAFNLPPQQADIAEELRSNTLNGGVNYDIFTPNLLNKFSIYFSGQFSGRDSYYGTGKDPNAFGNTDNYTVVGGVQYTRKLPQLGRWGSATNVLGMEVKADRVKDEMPSYNRLIDQSVQIYSLFNQFDLRIRNRVTVSAGIRGDYHNLIRNVVFSPRMGVVVNPVRGLNLRLNYALGYRAPQAFDEDLHIASVGGEVQLIRLVPNLRTETSHSLTGTVDYTHKVGYFQFKLLFTGFYTRLLNPFVLVDGGTDTAGNGILLRTNGTGASVYGGNVEFALAYGSKLQFEAGFTYQQARNDDPIRWSEDATLSTRQLLRTPDLYGYFLLTATPWRTLQVNVNGNYTGPMLSPHFAGTIPADRLVRTPHFFTLNVRVGYTFKLGKLMSLSPYVGVQNITNSYQRDFDNGINRDATYVYGPLLPRTLYFGVKIGSL
jgi:outer membrane receptor for ferrienterochelin and colicins